MSKSILFIGDSLIEYNDWQEYLPEHRVYNLGIAGEMVEGLHSRTDSIVKKFPGIDMIFIMTGINNIAIDDYDFLPLYGAIIDKFSRAYPQAEIFIHSILPTLMEWLQLESIQRVNTEIEALAKQKNAVFIDLYSHFVDKEGRPIRSYLLSDGVHLSSEGYRVWSKVIKKFIDR